MNDYDLGTSTTIEVPAYECCEMKTAAFVGLGCVMAVILVIVLIWFIRRKGLTKQYTLNKQTPKNVWIADSTIRFCTTGS